jgi:hypothetical protein
MNKVDSSMNPNPEQMQASPSFAKASLGFLTSATFLATAMVMLAAL